MTEQVSCTECGKEYDGLEFSSCPDCAEEEVIFCDECGHEIFSEEEDCSYCDEWVVPEGTECEFCEAIATRYVQDHPVCDEHYDDAYPID